MSDKTGFVTDTAHFELCQPAEDAINKEVHDMRHRLHDAEDAQRQAEQALDKLQTEVGGHEAGSRRAKRDTAVLRDALEMVLVVCGNHKGARIRSIRKILAFVGVKLP